MKKIVSIVLGLILSCAVVFASGDQNQGETGSGSTTTGSGANGSASQDRSGR